MDCAEGSKSIFVFCFTLTLEKKNEINPMDYGFKILVNQFRNDFLLLF